MTNARQQREADAAAAAERERVEAEAAEAAAAVVPDENPGPAEVPAAVAAAAEPGRPIGATPKEPYSSLADQVDTALAQSLAKTAQGEEPPAPKEPSNETGGSIPGGDATS